MKPLVFAFLAFVALRIVWTWVRRYAVPSGPSRFVQMQRNAMKPGLRFEILRRDGYRCQLCGRCAADGIALEVDHRVPVARGGVTERENLWTLCHDCNAGKSDKPL